MDSCPKELGPFEKAHKARIQEQDYMNWLSGQYVLSAVSVAVERCLAGRKAKSQYIEKPITESAEEKEYEKKNDRPEYEGMSEEEKEEAEFERAKDYFNSLIARF